MRRLRLPPRPGFVSLLTTALIGVGCTSSHPAGLSPQMDGPERIVSKRSMVALPRELEADRLLVWRDVQGHYLDERVVLANQTATAGENVVDMRTLWRGTPYAPVFSRPMPNPFTKAKISKRIANT